MIKKIIIFCVAIVGFSSLANAQISGCPTISLTGTATSCYGGSDGSATVFVSNVNPGYTISWSDPSATVTASTGFILEAGTYTVIVKDTLTGCSVTGAYNVNSPDPIVINETITDVSCKDSLNGQISLNVTGGTSPYMYDFGFGSGPSNVATVGEGWYVVNVTDDNLCLATETYYVDQPLSSVEISYVTENVDCKFGATGSIDVNMNNTGTPPYLYNWTGPGVTGFITEDVNNLVEGTYVITVTDANGCSSTSSGIPILEPTDVLLSDMFLTPNVDVSCFGFSGEERVFSCCCCCGCGGCGCGCGCDCGAHSLTHTHTHKRRQRSHTQTGCLD